MQNRITRHIKRSRLAWSFTLALAGLSLPVTADTGALVLDSAWVRAMPPGRPMTAAYLRVENPSGDPVSVTSVRASRGSASLHESRSVDGQMQMREVPELVVPARGSAVLEPGGLHIMLMGLASTPAEGESLTLCVESTAGEVCTDAPVLRRPPSQEGVGSEATAPSRH